MTDDTPEVAMPRDTLLLFALDLPTEAVAALRGDAGALARALGLPSLTPHRVEVVDLADLTGLGLATYLTEGLGLDPSQITADRGQIDALRGPVLVLQTGALIPDVLTPAPALRLIATYPLPTTPVRFEPLPDAAATGLLPQGKPVWSDARMGGMVATAALIFIALFTLAFIWMA